MAHISQFSRTFIIACLLGIAICLGAAGTSCAQASASSAPVRLTLPQAVDLALAHSNRVALAKLTVQDRQEEVKIARSQYFPRIDNSSKINHITELQGVVIPAGAFGGNATAGLVPSQTVRIDQGASTSYESITALSQPLTQIVKIRSGVQAAVADLASSKSDQADLQHSISLQVHQLYYSYLISKLTAEAAKDSLTAAEADQRESRKSVDEGRLLIDADLSNRAAVLSKKKAVLDARLAIDDITLKLDDLLGLPLGTKLELDEDVLGEHPKLPTRDLAMSEVLEKSPVIQAAQQNVQKAKANVATNREDYIPNITGFAHYDYQSGLPLLKHNFGSFGLALSYNLFDGGARQAKLRDAKIKLSAAETQLLEAKNSIRIELSDAYDQMEELATLQLVTKQLLEARTEGYRLATQRLRAEAALPSAVDEARAAQAAARTDLVSAQMRLFLAEFNISKLLGQLPR